MEKRKGVKLANVADVKLPDEQRAQGIRPGRVRLSIGTEHNDDLLYELQQALEGSQKRTRSGPFFIRPAGR